MNSQEKASFRALFPTFVIGTWVAVFAIVMSSTGFLESTFFSTLIFTSAIPALFALYYFILVANHTKHQNNVRLPLFRIPSSKGIIEKTYDMMVNVFIYSWVYNILVIIGGIYNANHSLGLGVNRQVIITGFILLFLIEFIVASLAPNPKNHR